MLNLIEKIYYLSPVFIQNLFISLYGYKLYRERYIGNHDSDLDTLLDSQWLSKDIIDKTNNENFMHFFHYAIKHAPYYRNLVSDGRINPSARFAHSCYFIYNGLAVLTVPPKSVDATMIFTPKMPWVRSLAFLISLFRAPM